MKKYRFKLRVLAEIGEEDIWTEWFPAMSYSDARRQMRLAYRDGKLLDYELEGPVRA